MSKRIMIIDHSAVCHAVKFGFAKQGIDQIKDTPFIVYGYFLTFQYLIKNIQPKLIAFACDSKESKRKEIYPEYKDRDKNKTEENKQLDEIAYPQFNLLKEKVLPKIGYKNIFESKGLEADDIIARICKHYSNNEIVIVSRDNDLWQLLSDKVAMFDPSLKQWFTKGDLQKKWEVTPKEWGKIKRIVGCSGDNVQGIKGVAAKTAIKYLKGELSKTTKNGKPLKTYEAITSDEGKKIIKRNKKLVILPFKNTPTYYLQDDYLSLEGFKKVIKKYKFKSIQKDIEYWKYVLRLK